MHMSIVIVVLFSVSFQVFASEPDILDSKEQTKGVDSTLQSDVKLIVARYLLETAIEGEDSARYNDNPIPYGKHKHHSSSHDRYNELLQKLIEQEKRLQQLKETGSVPVQKQTVASQQAKIEPVVTAAPAVVTAPLSTSAPLQPAQALQEPVTQIPVILTTPAPVPAPQPTLAAVTSTSAPIVNAPTVDPIHHLNQVDKILGNVANGNIVGIVDESLAIRAPAPVRQLVTNIMKVIFCNPIDRLFRRCAPNQVDAAKNSVKGK